MFNMVYQSHINLPDVSPTEAMRGVLVAMALPPLPQTTFPNKTGGNVFSAGNTRHIDAASCYFSGGIERAVRHQIISCVYVFPQHMAMAARRTAAA